MSRSLIYLFAIATIAPGAAIAQQGPPATAQDRAIAEKMLGNGGRITRDTSRNACLRTVRQGEIVVCAPETDQFRVPSTGDDDPTGAGADDGRLRTPEVSGNGIFKGKPTMSGLCVIPPCPPEQPYLIDLSTIPMAPAGSDADKIAKGELRAP